MIHPKDYNKERCKQASRPQKPKNFLWNEYSGSPFQMGAYAPIKKHKKKKR